MAGDKELLGFLNENVTMGLEALETLAKKLESTDNKIKSNVDKALAIYREYKKKIDKKTEGEPLKKGNLLSIIMAKMGTNTEFMRDNSDSKIADTLIQGYNMGLIDITKKISKYKGEVSRDVLKLARDYEDMMKQGIKDIKGFL